MKKKKKIIIHKKLTDLGTTDESLDFVLPSLFLRMPKRLDDYSLI